MPFISTISFDNTQHGTIWKQRCKRPRVSNWIGDQRQRFQHKWCTLDHELHDCLMPGSSVEVFSKQPFCPEAGWKLPKIESAGREPTNHLAAILATAAGFTHTGQLVRVYTHTHTHTHIRSQTRPHTLIKVRNSPAKPIRLHSAAVRFWRFFGRTECNNKTKQKQNRNKTETKPKQNKNTITTKQNDAECRYKRRAASAEHRPPVHRVTQRWRPSMHALSSLSLTLFSQPKLVFVLLLSFELDGLRATALFPYSISIDVSI